MDFPKISLSYGIEVLAPKASQAIPRSLSRNPSCQGNRPLELSAPAETASPALQINDCHLLIFQQSVRRQTIANIDVG